jgi:SAM-dependent methyltransferase
MPLPRRRSALEIQRGLPQGGRVLDVGCLGFGQYKLAQSIGRSDLLHSGVDFSAPSAVPEGYNFASADLNASPIPFGDDTFDLVVASHVMEHIRDPIRFFGDCVRVCRPGGLMLLSTPSERSLWLPGCFFEHEKFYSTSYFDDPTHVGRPQTAGSLVRLARYFGCDASAWYMSSWRWRIAAPFLLPVALVFRSGLLLERLAWKTFGWEVCALVQKPSTITGLPEMNYYIPPDRASTDPVYRLYAALRGRR